MTVEELHHKLVARCQAFKPLLDAFVEECNADMKTLVGVRSPASYIAEELQEYVDRNSK